MFDKLFKKEQPSSFEEQRRGLMKRLLKVALENPVTEKELLLYSELINNINLSKREELFLDEIEQKTNISTVHTNNLFDFKIAMELLGQSDEYIKDVVEHENAHANKTEELGALFGGYRITFFKNVRGEIIPQPSAKYDVPENWDKNRRKKVEREILLAPKTYGNKLSGGDIEMLDALDEKYKK